MTMAPESKIIFDTNEYEASVEISKQGLRNEIVKTPKPKDAFRILALGDSFTFGWGVNLEDTWVKMLENKLQIPGKKVEVINAGMSGADLMLEMQICRAYKWRFDPDLILIGFYAADDLYQNTARIQSEKLASKITSFFIPTLSRLNQPIIDKSALYLSEDDKPQKSSNLWSRNANIMTAKYPEILKVIDPKILPDFLKGKINPVMVEFALMDRQYLIKILDTENRKTALSAFEKSLAGMKNDCLGKIPAVLFVIPPNHMISKIYFPNQQALGFHTDERMLSLDLDSELKPITEKSGLKYISALSYLRNFSCNDCYYAWDSHFTKKGNEIIADFLSEELGKNLQKK